MTIGFGSERLSTRFSIVFTGCLSPLRLGYLYLTAFSPHISSTAMYKYIYLSAWQFNTQSYANLFPWYTFLCFNPLFPTPPFTLHPTSCILLLFYSIHLPLFSPSFSNALHHFHSFFPFSNLFFLSSTLVPYFWVFPVHCLLLNLYYTIGEFIECWFIHLCVSFSSLWNPDSESAGRVTAFLYGRNKIK